MRRKGYVRTGVPPSSLENGPYGRISDAQPRWDTDMKGMNNIIFP